MQAPILSRTMLLEKLRDGTFRHHDWNLVTTTLGAMLEPRTLVRPGGEMKNDDVYDSNYTDWLVLDGAAESGLLDAGLSLQWPRVFNTL